MAETMQPQEEKKKGKGKLIMILVVVLAVAGGAYFFLFSGGGAPADETAASTTMPQVEGVSIDGATMTVALPGEDASFVRISYALVLAETADSAVVGNKAQVLQDRALVAILGFEADELRTVAGVDRLRDALTAYAHEVYPDGDVVRIVLTEVIVQ